MAMPLRHKVAGLKVRDVFNIDDSLAIIVPGHMPFEEVVRRFAQRADLRGVFVVDGKQRLTGVITRQDLLHWAAGHLHLRDPIPDSWRDIYRVMGAAVAQDACRPRSERCSVKPDQKLEEVLYLMLENELIDIPVVDDEGTILGDVRLTEILAKVFETQAGA